MSQVFIGHLTIDDIVCKYRNINKNNVLGGAVMYSACGSVACGGIAKVISLIGDNYPMQELYDFCYNSNIDISKCRKVGKKAIHLKIVYDQFDEHTFIKKSDSGTYKQLAPCASDVPAKVIDENMVFHITPLPLDNQIEIAMKIKKKNKIVTVDPDITEIKRSKQEKWHKLFDNINFLLISKREFECFEKEFYINNIKHIDIFERISRLQCLFNIDNIVLKFGSLGIYYVEGKNIRLHFPSYKTKVLDTTGAGDAFAGGFGYGLTNSGSCVKSIIYGIFSSSLAVEGFGFFHMLNRRNEFDLQERFETIEKGIKVYE